MIGGLFGKEMELGFGATFCASSSTSTSTSTSLLFTSFGLDDSTSLPLLSVMALHCPLDFSPYH